MNIPFVDLKKQYLAIKTEIDTAIADIVSKTAFIGGDAVATFEKNYAKYLHAKHCIGVGNGTDALSIALKAYKIGPGDEVIVPANSFIATSEAVTNVGAKVVFVDNHSDTYLIDVNLIEKKITRNTKAIIPVHLYGLPADLDALRAICDRYNLKMIQDCAQAHGALYKGKQLIEYGDALCYSFYPGKNLGAYGDGGAIVTNDDVCADWMIRYANHGRKDKYNHGFEGINSRLDGMQAAILDVKLKHLDVWTERRIKAASIYDAKLSKKVEKTKVPQGSKHVYHLYVIRVQDREALQFKLKEKGVSTGIHYPIALPLLEAYKYLGHTTVDFPIAAHYMDQLLSLPMYGDIGQDEVEYVCQAVNSLV